MVCGCQRADTATSGSGIGEDSLAATKPSVPDFAIWRPFFFTEFGNQAIDDIRGTAFVVKVGAESKVFLVTAFHLLGPKGGLIQQIEPGQVRKLVNDVVISETFGATDKNIATGLPIDPPLDQFDKDYWIDADVLLIPTDGAKARYVSLEFANETPKVGETVWLVTAVFGGAPASDSAHEAAVVEVAEDGTMRYEFRNSELKLDGADGAPLVNLAGKVVGMHQFASDSEVLAAASSQETDGEKETTEAAVGAKAAVEGRGVSAAKVREAIERMLPPAGQTQS